MTAQRVLAGFLSYLVPGRGQVRNGNLGLAAFCFIAFMLLLPGGYRLLLVLPRPANLILLWATIGLVAFSVVEAAIHTSGTGIRRKPAKPVVIALGIGMFASSRGLALVNNELNVQMLKIPTGGMHPTLLVGDHLAVDRAAYGWRNALAGDWFWRWGGIQRTGRWSSVTPRRASPV